MGAHEDGQRSNVELLIDRKSHKSLTTGCNDLLFFNR